MQSSRFLQHWLPGVFGVGWQITFGAISRIRAAPPLISRSRDLEKVANRTCPRCGQSRLNVYYSDQTDNRVGAWCEYCNLKAYYYGEELVPINS